MTRQGKKEATYSGKKEATYSGYLIGCCDCPGCHESAQALGYPGYIAVTVEHWTECLDDPEAQSVAELVTRELLAGRAKATTFTTTTRTDADE
jgi:hypothetical protein